jgi:molybdopterin-guanine dinucleotide biosynthesis protein A
MIRNVVDRQVPIVDQIVVNIRRSQRSSVGAVLADVPCPVQFAIDSHVDCGPVAGLRTALDIVSDKTALILACDLPLLRTATLSALLEQLNDADGDKFDCVLPLVDGHPQPLSGAYTVGTLDSAINRFQTPRHKSFKEVLSRLQVLTVPGEQLPGGREAFENVNTRDDLQNIRSIFRNRETAVDSS